MARSNPFAPERIVTRAPADDGVPPNLSGAALDLYRVVHRLVRNDGRMTSDDYSAAVEAVRLARQS